MAKSKIANRLVEMSTLDIKSLTAKEAKQLLREARMAVDTQMEKLAKASYTKSGKQSSSFYSAAYENMLDWQEEHFDLRKVSPSKTKRVNAVAELQSYKKFFGSKSSTVSGSREIMKSQDARIFGVDSSGKPLKRMTRVQRERFWSLYDEFSSGEYTADLAYRAYAAGTLESSIGKIVTERGRKRDPETGRFVGWDLGEAIEELKKRLRDDEYDTSEDDLLSGKWSDL